MDLEQRVRKVVVQRTPAPEILEEVANGNKFIIVGDDFDGAYVPPGYTLIDMRYKGESFKTLVPQQLLFFMANPGTGDLEEALDSIADFYGEAEQYEDELIENGQTSVQESNWATLSRSTYRTYLINKLVQGTNGNGNGESENSGENANGNPVPEFNKEVLRQLDLDDPYVSSRIKLIAGLALNKSADELQKYDIKDLLQHYGVFTNKTEKISDEEFRKITKFRRVSHWDQHTKTMRCLADSHYDLKPEYINNPTWDYDLKTMTKTGKFQAGINAPKIAELLKEIQKHRAEKHGNIGSPGRHDEALLRMYTNLAYIIPENQKAQLDITPPMKSTATAEDK